MKIVSISAHADDSILSTGQILSAHESTIVTVFAGNPQNPDILTAYDHMCGFTTSGESMQRRREEDIEACAMIAASYVHLDFTDQQYAEKFDSKALILQLQKVIDDVKPDIIMGPLGINHRDHVFANEATMELAKNNDIPTYLYEDLPNRIIDPEIVPDSLQRVTDWGFHPQKDSLVSDPLAKKLIAIMCYKSQLMKLDIHTLVVPERLWKIN